MRECTNVCVMNLEMMAERVCPNKDEVWMAERFSGVEMKVGRHVLKKENCKTKVEGHRNENDNGLFLEGRNVEGRRMQGCSRNGSNMEEGSV